MADVRGAGPAIVLLHGQPGSRRDWALVADQLAGGYTVISPDRPGYGETGGRARGFRGNAAAVLSLLDRLGVAQATVVAHSWAGGIALALAEEAPPRVTAMVLVSSISPDEPVTWIDRLLAVPPIGAATTTTGLFLASAALSLSPVRRALLRQHGVLGLGSSGPGFSGGAAAGMAAPVAGTGGAVERMAAPEALGALVASWRRDGVGQSFVTEQRCLIDELPLLAPALSRINVPTVVVVGTADRVVPPGTGRRLARTIPGARLIEVAGAGHLLAYQHPDEVAEAIGSVASGGARAPS